MMPLDYSLSQDQIRDIQVRKCKSPGCQYPTRPGISKPSPTLPYNHNLTWRERLVQLFYTFDTRFVQSLQSLIRKLPRDLHPAAWTYWTEEEEYRLWTTNPRGTRFVNPVLEGRSVRSCRKQLLLLRTEAEKRIRAHKDFYLFSKFPRALRERIWGYACNEPRTVEVHTAHWFMSYKALDEQGALKEYGGLVNHFESISSPPTLLETCRESRRIALKMYKKSDLANLFIPDSVYFEYEVDTMYLMVETSGLWFESLSRWVHGRSGEKEDEDVLVFGDDDEPSFVPKSPAGRGLLKVRNLAVDEDAAVLWKGSDWSLRVFPRLRWNKKWCQLVEDEMAGAGVKDMGSEERDSWPDSDDIMDGI